MTARILRIELRRSSALRVAAVIAVLGAGAVHLDTRSGLTGVALGQRELLALFWPLALGAGAWQARRERRCRVEELIGTTARPRWQRVLPTAAAMAAGVVVGYLAMYATGVALTARKIGYVPVGVLPILATGALSLVVAVWLGLAVGSRLPAAATAPLLGIAAVPPLLVGPGMLFERLDYGAAPASALLLLFPNPGEVTSRPTSFLTLSARAHVSQVLWLAGVAAAALLLYAATSARARLAAVLPAGLAFAGTLALLPGSLEAAFVPDRGAVERVCAAEPPTVCVTRLHAAALPALRGPAQQALRLLAAKLPAPPTAVLEAYAPGDTAVPQRADAVLIWLPDAARELPSPEDFRWYLLGGAGTQPCDVLYGSDRYLTARLVAAAWLLGEPPPTSDGPGPAAADGALAGRTYAALLALPPAEQRARVAALRAAELACSGQDRLDLLTAPGPPR